MATNRQFNLLNLIVDIYVKNGEPVSSAQVVKKIDGIKISGATTRYEMVSLEKEGYLYKLDENSSRTSGRIPTNKAYDYYLKYIKTNPKSILKIKKKLDLILKKRKDDIDKLLEEALEVINEATNTLTISLNNLSSNILLDIKIYKTEENKAMLIIITSNGEVIKREIDLTKNSFEEFQSVVDLLAKRLINIPIGDLEKNSQLLKEVISLKVKGIEDKFQEIIKTMFSKIVYQNEKYTGMNNLISKDNLNIESQIKTIFKMIENNSIWKLLDNKNFIKRNDSEIFIDIDAMDGISIVNKEINYGNKNKKLTILGSKNQDYEKLFSMLEYLDKIVKESW